MHQGRWSDDGGNEIDKEREMRNVFRHYFNFVVINSQENTGTGLGELACSVELKDVSG